MTSSHRYKRLEELFEAVRDLPPTKRTKLLDEQCADDPELRSELEALLAKHADPGGFLESPALGPGFNLKSSIAPGGTAADLGGQRIGGYKLARVVATADELVAGLVTEVLDRCCDNLRGSEAYLCGPPGMIDAAIGVLREKGLFSSHIRFDKFVETGG